MALENIPVILTGEDITLLKAIIEVYDDMIGKNCPVMHPFVEKMKDKLYKAECWRQSIP